MQRSESAPAATAAAPAAATASHWKSGASELHPSEPEFYFAVALRALARVLQDPSLVKQYREAMQVRASLCIHDYIDVGVR